MSASIGQTIVSVEKRSDAIRAGILFTFGGLLFLLLTTAAEAVYPNFSMQNNAISDLAALGTSTTAIEETAILGLGMCWIAGAYLLFRNTGRRGMMFLNMAPGVGFLLAGLSPENVNLTIHSIGAAIGFPLGAIAVILSFRMIRTPFRYVTLALGALSLVGIIVIFGGYQVVGPCGTCVGHAYTYGQSLDRLYLGLGGWESMIIYPFLIWLIGFGSYLLTASSEASR